MILSIIKKSSEYIIFENENYLLVKINNFYSNYNIVKCIDINSNWCTLNEKSFNNLTSDGKLYRLYDKKNNELYSIYVLNNDLIRHVIDTKHNRLRHLIKKWNIPFLNNLNFENK